MKKNFDKKMKKKLFIHQSIRIICTQERSQLTPSIFKNANNPRN